MQTTRRIQRRLERRTVSTVIADIPTGLSSDGPLLMDRPDGVHWQSPDGTEERGPFESYELARADFRRFSEESASPSQVLQETERELDLDPETPIDENRE